MRVLVACEYSGTVRDAFAARGHDAWSCDILPSETTGNHIRGDALDAAYGERWDLMIAHPPCTYLTLTGNKWFKPEYAERFPTRQQDRQDAIDFFMALADAPVEKIAIENPICIMSSVWRKPDQIVHPYYFGDPPRKATCLWLKNLPALWWCSTPSLFGPPTAVEPEGVVVSKGGNRTGQWYYNTGLIPLKSGLRAKVRSKTFPGIANAMAEQWG
jgi:hypothetical protein